MCPDNSHFPDRSSTDPENPRSQQSTDSDDPNPEDQQGPTSPLPTYSGSSIPMTIPAPLRRNPCPICRSPVDKIIFVDLPTRESYLRTVDETITAYRQMPEVYQGGAEILIGKPEGVGLLGWELREFVMDEAKWRVMDWEQDGEWEEDDGDNADSDDLERFWLAELDFSRRE
ncbi:hypothetical protein K440DRAFT_645293 [Wilcoxina mikolae CBS 423.85]|nr:hypothetical protein K440DRAFT_645293 [Wilcoxina mikolae CBS 423.85]